MKIGRKKSHPKVAFLRSVVLLACGSGGVSSRSSNGSRSFNGCRGSSRGSGRSRCGFFFFTASSQGSSGDHGGQNEGLVHVGVSKKVDDNFRKLPARATALTKQTSLHKACLAFNYKTEKLING